MPACTAHAALNLLLQHAARESLPLHVLTGREAPCTPILISPKGMHACSSGKNNTAQQDGPRRQDMVLLPDLQCPLPTNPWLACGDARVQPKHTPTPGRPAGGLACSPCSQTTAQHWSLTRPDIMLAREAMLLRSSLRLVYPELARLTKLATTISSSSSLLSPPRRWRLKMACKRRCSKGQRLGSGWHSQHWVFSACRQAIDAVSEDGLP